MKKLMALVIATAMLTPYASISLSADEVESNADSDDSKIGTIFFDSGDWNSDKLYFYIWDETDGTYASKNGWSDSNLWGSKKLAGTEVEGKDGVFESYEIEFKDDHDLFVIFYDPNTGAQTYNCVLNSSAIGDTAYMTKSILENPEDSEKTCIEARFTNADCGPQLKITSSGKIIGEYITPNTDCPLQVARFVFNYFGQQEKLTGDEIVTNETVKNAIDAFGTTPDDVWAKFQEFDGKPGYEEYDLIAEDAKKVIYGTLIDSDTDSSIDSDTDSSIDEDSDSDTIQALDYTGFELAEKTLSEIVELMDGNYSMGMKTWYNESTGEELSQMFIRNKDLLPGFSFYIEENQTESSDIDSENGNLEEDTSTKGDINQSYKLSYIILEDSAKLDDEITAGMDYSQLVDIIGEMDLAVDESSNPLTCSHPTLTITGTNDTSAVLVIDYEGTIDATLFNGTTYVSPEDLIAANAYVSKIIVYPYVIDNPQKLIGIYGDMNADGIVNSIDALLVQRSIVGYGSLTEDEKLIADVNLDGFINSLDVLHIMRYCIGYTTDSNVAWNVYVS